MSLVDNLCLSTLYCYPGVREGSAVANHLAESVRTAVTANSHSEVANSADLEEEEESNLSAAGLSAESHKRAAAVLGADKEANHCLEEAMSNVDRSDVDVDRLNLRAVREGVSDRGTFVATVAKVDSKQVRPLMEYALRVVIIGRVCRGLGELLPMLLRCVKVSRLSQMHLGSYPSLLMALISSRLLSGTRYGEGGQCYLSECKTAAPSTVLTGFIPQVLPTLIVLLRVN